MRVRRQLDAARHDPLTGLLGRDGCTARAAALTARYNRAAMVLICDVANDTHGHAAGDRVLAVTAQRLTACAGSRSIVGRLGGDEFALAVRIAPAHRLMRLGQLAAALAEPVDVAVSVGAATPTGSAPPTCHGCSGPPTPRCTRASTPARPSSLTVPTPPCRPSMAGGARSPHPSGRCQPEISLRPDPRPMEILRGLARPVIGMRRVSTPAS
ncbi:GGDEF domain-containing protein [Streptomyces sp. NRRL S-813]|uniref:GGDEF domain-containing protein n=1 Tax=Streptomyces sp. NRRL S-813 TaxID=1463919 RepID=UPI001F3424F1|nr:GGDEF domain-containing protein [Streptomyces sp. NRRL S-813]